MTTQQEQPQPQTEPPRELGERVAHIEGTLVQVDKRLDNLERTLVGFRSEMTARLDTYQQETNARFARMEDKLDRLEDKLDRQADKFDRQADKLDRIFYAGIAAAVTIIAAFIGIDALS